MELVERELQFTYHYKGFLCAERSFAIPVIIKALVVDPGAVAEATANGTRCIMLTRRAVPEMKKGIKAKPATPAARKTVDAEWRPWRHLMM